MLHLIRRLHDIARLINRSDLVDLAVDEKQLPEQLRNELEATILTKEIELNDLQNYATEIDDIAAAITASFGGGPDGPGADNNDNDTE